MGKVDSANGFMKELVIVDGDSTEPQYGGGLCQVSSTLFRTIFFAGLPVISRVSHSFEVKYYRPAGLDATIFDPYPNLVFENDTKNLLLIQNYVDLNRTKMYFKFFGKHDGRRLRFAGPTVLDSVGEKKEHYRVTWYRYIDFPDGTSRTDKFMSVYLNKDLVKKFQPENLLVKKDSVFVPAYSDSAKKEENKTLIDETKPSDE
jgi:vancomycin resistance protein YoaR